jgi:hypothetical protein
VDSNPSSSLPPLCSSQFYQPSIPHLSKLASYHPLLTAHLVYRQLVLGPVYVFGHRTYPPHVHVYSIPSHVITDISFPIKHHHGKKCRHCSGSSSTGQYLHGTRNKKVQWLLLIKIIGISHKNRKIVKIDGSYF